MADDTVASIIPLHHVPLKKRAKKVTARSGTKRQRKRKTTVAVAEEAEPASSESFLPSEFLIPPEFLPANDVAGEPLATLPPPHVAPRQAETVAPARVHFASALLSIAALALAAVGITINGWFARSLGSSDVAGWLFLAVGVAADLVALVMPSCAAGLWQGGQRATALVGWALWLVTFAFAVTAGVRVATTTITDATPPPAAR